MEWNKKYKDLTTGFYKCANDISFNYPECNDFEKCVISLRLNGWTYGNIQKKLGMPPKKEISKVLNTWAPELVNNAKTKVVKINQFESEVYNIIRIQPNKQLNVMIEDEIYTFYIKDNKLLFSDWSANDNLFHDLNETTQQQFLINIKDKINE